MPGRRGPGCTYRASRGVARRETNHRNRCRRSRRYGQILRGDTSAQRYSCLRTAEVRLIFYCIRGGARRIGALHNIGALVSEKLPGASHPEEFLVVCTRLCIKDYVALFEVGCRDYRAADGRSLGTPVCDCRCANADKRQRTIRSDFVPNVICYAADDYLTNNRIARHIIILLFF